MLGLTDESIYPSQKVGSTGQSDQPRRLVESNLSIGSTQLGQISQNSLHRSNATISIPPSPPKCPVCTFAECRHVALHPAPACAPLMQLSWSKGSQEEEEFHCFNKVFFTVPSDFQCRDEKHVCANQSYFFKKFSIKKSFHWLIKHFSFWYWKPSSLITIA